MGRYKKGFIFKSFVQYKNQVWEKYRETVLIKSRCIEPKSTWGKI